MSKKENCMLMIKGLSREVRENFRIACMKRGRSMTEEIRLHIKAVTTGKRSK